MSASTRDAIRSADAAIARVRDGLISRAQLTDRDEAEHVELRAMIEEARTLELEWADRLAWLMGLGRRRTVEPSATARFMRGVA